MNLVNQVNDLSTETDFFELTPSEWWEEKINQTVPNSIYHSESEKETIYKFWGVPYEKPDNNPGNLDY